MRIRSADHQARVRQLGHVPAEHRGADPQALGQVRGAGLPFTNEPEHALEGDAGVLALDVDHGDAAQCALEVIDGADEIGCSGRCDRHDPP